jgi:hypothetical protein
MPKATLEFDLADHDDRLAHIRAAKATEAYIVLFEVSERLREVCDRDEPYTATQALGLLLDTMDNYGVSLDDIE